MRDIGLDVKKPENKCQDENCPFHGHLKVRGRVFQGEVISDKGENTVSVRWNYYHKIPKYERKERRRTIISAHNPKCIDAKIHDKVKIAECRSLSKTKSFVVIEKVIE